MMKRILALCAALGLFFPALGRAMDNGGSYTLYIYNWPYYVPDSIIEKFEKEYGVTVVYDGFQSEEDMYARIAAGNPGYDIVFSSQEYTSLMISQGMFKRIDKSMMPNLQNLNPAVLRKAAHDPGMDYAVPYYFGAACIMVNTARVPQFERSWSIFAHGDLAGRMTMLDNMREVMGAALKSLGCSVNTKNPAEIKAAGDLINARWKPNLVKFDAETFGEAYADGDLWVIQGYLEAVFSETIHNAQLRKDTVFFIPPEGGPSYIDSMCILKGSQNIDLAHAFINFIHRPEIYAEFTDFFNFPSTVNIPARSLKKEPPCISERDILGTEPHYDLGEALNYYDEAWHNIKAGR
ncbi:MAG: extracellular solute-binding protein [Treponema sp.]|jgi:spermidine/putrescine transport system substrate-binding protein|nr:extracellular solute-binding protein [Treponema sp.]